MHLPFGEIIPRVSFLLFPLNEREERKRRQTLKTRLIELELFAENLNNIQGYGSSSTTEIFCGTVTEAVFGNSGVSYNHFSCESMTQ